MISSYFKKLKESERGSYFFLFRFISTNERSRVQIILQKYCLFEMDEWEKRESRDKGIQTSERI